MAPTPPSSHLPVCFDVVILQGKELFLNLVPALQAAPQPVGVYNMEVLAVLSLPYFFCAYYKVKHNITVFPETQKITWSTRWFKKNILWSVLQKKQNTPPQSNKTITTDKNETLNKMQ